MGFFSVIKKIRRILGLDKTVIRIGSKNSKNNTTSYSSNTASINKANVPSEYSAFPKFEGNCTYGRNKVEKKYIRYTMDFDGVSQDDMNKYLDAVDLNGYYKATKVRYEKNNTYIIIEYSNGYLHLVFHIKK